jgi:hypothetical protein
MREIKKLLPIFFCISAIDGEKYLLDEVQKRKLLRMRHLKENQFKLKKKA